MSTTTIITVSRQGHKHADSMDSETSFFEMSSTCTNDSWTSYFDGWDNTGSDSSDSYCPQIVNFTASSTPATQYHTLEQQPEERCKNFETKHKRPRPDSLSLPSMSAMRREARVKRFGIVSQGDPRTENVTISRFNTLLQNPSSSTDELLDAMYNPDWDIASLQKWYNNSSRSAADLALYKIMFSLRYTPDERQTPR